MNKALAEVTTRTRELSLTATSTPDRFTRLHIHVPLLRALVKSGYSFYVPDPRQVLKSWDYIWKHADFHEVAHQALYYYQHRTLRRFEFDAIKHWVNRCDSWEHSDDLSKIYAGVVEDNPDWILPLYERWNIAKSPWKRRQSVVGLIEYASKRKLVLPYADLIRFVEPLLRDPDYYVQKGVGWTLREIYNVYPGETTLFLHRHIKSLSPQAFSSSTEKLDKAEKTALKQLRKN